MTYLDLCNSDTFNAIYDTLVNYYGLDEKLVDFAFDSYWRNEDTLDHITYYYGIEQDALLRHAGLDTEDEDDDEDDD